LPKRASDQRGIVCIIIHHQNNRFRVH
jgi:hypothetical protein